MRESKEGLDVYFTLATHSPTAIRKSELASIIGRGVNARETLSLRKVTCPWLLKPTSVARIHLATNRVKSAHPSCADFFGIWNFFFVTSSRAKFLQKGYFSLKEIIGRGANARETLSLRKVTCPWLLKPTLVVRMYLATNRVKSAYPSCADSLEFRISFFVTISCKKAIFL